MTTVAAEPGRASETILRGGKYLTLFLGDEEYGIDILRVREIIGLMQITDVPRTPDHIRGVVNLRGKVVPVVELRSRLDLAAVEATEETVIIVVQTGDEIVGLIVDRVSEVTDIPSEEIVDAPSFGADVNTEYILGVGKSEERVRLLLDIDQVLDTIVVDEPELNSSS